MPIVSRTRLFKTACGVWLVALAVVVCSWDVSIGHGVKAESFHTVPNAYVPAAHDHSQRNQPNTTRGLKQSCSTDDGHNGARNMLRIF